MYTEITLTREEHDKYVNMMKKRVDSKTLTAEQYQMALFEARERKYYDANIVSRYWKNVNASGENTPRYTWQQLRLMVIKSFVQHTGTKFRIMRTNHGHAIIDLLSQYFTESPEFENTSYFDPETGKIINCGYSRQKGIMLMGPVGCTKTSTMRMFRANQYACFNVKSCLQIAESYISEEKEHKRDILEFHSKLGKTPLNSNQFRHTVIGTCFDDLGIEDVRKKFGNETNVMAYILTRRYDQVPKQYTHVTTNLSADDIEDFYGSRLRSRMAEMFNVIKFRSPGEKNQNQFDQRKTKQVKIR